MNVLVGGQAAGDRCKHRGKREGEHLHCRGVDPQHPRRVLVSSDRHPSVTDFGPPQSDGDQHPHHHEGQGAVREGQSTPRPTRPRARRRTGPEKRAPAISRASKGRSCRPPIRRRPRCQRRRSQCNRRSDSSLAPSARGPRSGCTSADRIDSGISEESANPPTGPRSPPVRSIARRATHGAQAYNFFPAMPWGRSTNKSTRTPKVKAWDISGNRAPTNTSTKAYRIAPKMTLPTSPKPPNTQMTKALWV